MDIPKIYLIFLLSVIWRTKASFNKTDQQSYRLPDFFRPSTYELTLHLDPELNIFTGQVIIEVTILASTKNIFLHASPTRIMNITGVMIDLSEDCVLSSWNKKTEIVNITCPRSLEKNEVHKIFIDYVGAFGTTGSEKEYFGFYKSSYQTSEDTQYYAVTQFEPTFARSAFPCFDEPQDKATFKVTVNHPVNYTVLFNTGINQQSSVGERVLTKFHETPTMSTYLVALFVSKFKVSSDNITSKPVIKVYSRDNQVEHTGTAIKYGRDLVDALGNWLYIKYDQLGIDKLDMVAVPDFTMGAMENWGLITFQEADLLDEGKQTSAADKQNIIVTIAHELAHHWFGDCVTLDWWSDTWLNEGFATFFQYYIPDKVKNLNMELERQFVPLCLHAALDADGAESQPLSSPTDDIQTPDDDFDKFDAISYAKGASILRMIKSITGEENFQKSLQGYLTVNYLGSTSPEKFLYSIDEFYDREDIDIQVAMKNWIYQSGYPIVNVHFTDNSNKAVAISQREFPRNLHLDHDNDPYQQWSVPITYTTSKDKNFEIKDIKWLIDNKTLEISLEEDSWIIVNLQQMGYYRVNYNDELWNRIISALNSDDMKKIHVSNRAQLIDDVFSLSKVGKQNYRIAFKVASYLRNESEFEPWYAAAKSFNYISRLLEVHQDNDALHNLEKVVLQWINSAFPSNIIKLPTHLQLLTHNVVNELKCAMNDQKCLDESQTILRNYISTNKIPDHNRRKFALCFGLKTSKTPDDDYNNLLKIYKKSDSAIERKAILTSLGCLTDPVVLKKYLSELLSNNTVISRTDVKYVYRAVASNNLQGLKVTLPFLREHLKYILDRYSGLLTLSDLIMTPAKWITSDSQLTQLRDITLKYKNVEDMAEIAKKALELPSIYNYWFTLNKKDIESILSSMTGSSIFIVPNVILLILSTLLIVNL